MKKMADVTVAQTQRRCQLTEKELKEEIEKLKTKIDEETRVNMEIESFLRLVTTITRLLIMLRANTEAHVKILAVKN